MMITMPPGRRTRLIFVMAPFQSRTCSRSSVETTHVETVRPVAVDELSDITDFVDSWSMDDVDAYVSSRPERFDIGSDRAVHIERPDFEHTTSLYVSPVEPITNEVDHPVPAHANKHSIRK